MTTLYLLLCLSFFGGIACVAITEINGGGPSDIALAAFFVIMTVWAAGLLLLPHSIT